ncbi:protein SSUH2-like protein [Blastocystis sp. subtype 4]|uniref:protein SSUH2-like protein n=1 Tax=Blastocystis sp. subtype 4 TaxID=944170 RepID=UPI0007114EE9|nr:protein SSUH2-like protein [Blastocystis sp. subtype 4]KNB43306.1 protein SSUH2-like protein [Blastocystis sp. subtype 4]|eukprot:XP_014526749.1 protein SSUH2-like protein [Blastocystis sp. subtype 4]
MFPNLDPASIPSAQPMGNLAPNIQGYNTSSGGSVAVPANNLPKPGNDVVMTALPYNKEVITGEDMRESLKKLVSTKLFWGKTAVNKMAIEDMETWTCYYCTWETYMEKREYKWKSRPFRGGLIDSCNNGQPPQPWDVPVQPPPLFEEKTIKVAVPHTEYVQSCSGCTGHGRTQCKKCSGRGRQTCAMCNGRGYDFGEERVRCYHCNGEGSLRCKKCDGDGMIRCSTCEGTGNVIMYISLTVSFNNHLDFIVLNEKEIPEEMIREAEGTTICKQIGYRVLPPQGFFDPSILSACNTLYTRAEELRSSSTDALLQQRVTVYEIPCAKAIGNWKGKRGGFFVYGNNRTCFCPRYRQDFYGSCSFLLSVCSSNTFYVTILLRENLWGLLDQAAYSQES